MGLSAYFYMASLSCHFKQTTNNGLLNELVFYKTRTNQLQPE